MLPFRSFYICILGLTLLPVAPLAAQVSTSGITGQVTDPSNAVVPNAAVVVTNNQTGVRIQVLTNQDGLYRVTQLLPGSYSVEVSHPGFKRATQTGITLEVGAIARVDLGLEVGTASETVEVAASGLQLETETSNVGQVIENKTVSSMPLANRRSAALIALAATVNYTGDDPISYWIPRFSMAGGRPSNQVYQIDGINASNVRIEQSQLDINPPVDVIQEFRLVANNYAAEFGSSGSGMMLITTKSGTNELHGSAYEYMRNDAMDARNFFAATKAPLRYHLFGGTLGGPIRKNKTFFFGSFEGARQTIGNTNVINVPTPAQINGDFSHLLNTSGQVIPIYDPATTKPDPSRPGAFIRAQFPGNIIPSDRFDPVARNALQYYPAPNAPGLITGARNFISNSWQKFTREAFTARVDHEFSEKDRFYARHLFDNPNFDYSGLFANSGAPGDPRERVIPTRTQNFGAVETHQFSPPTINELRFTYNQRKWGTRSAGYRENWPSKLGLTGVSNDFFPEFYPAGYQNLGSWDFGVDSFQLPMRQITVFDSLSHIRGTHTFKFGGEFRRSASTYYHRPSPSGRFNFSPLATALPGVAGTGDSIASFLLGFPEYGTVQENPKVTRVTWYYALFIQDDWKITRKLTLNLGLRWDTDTGMTENKDRSNGFNWQAINPVSNTPGVVTFLGRNGLPHGYNFTPMKDFGPRVGFAWQAREKTVVRGGFGLFYNNPYEYSIWGLPALGFNTFAEYVSPDSSITAPFYLRNGFPGVPKQELTPGFGAVPVGQRTITSPTYFEPHRQIGYMEQVNFGVQHELPFDMIMELTYLGSFGRHVNAPSITQNQVRPEVMGPGTAQLRRPFPQFSNVVIANPTFGVSSYNAFVSKIEKRFSRGFNLIAHYTYSRFLDNLSSYQNYYNRRLDWGPSSLDIRHRFVASGVYELPFGPGKSMLAKGVLSQVLGGWSIGGVATAQTGSPYTLTVQNNTTNAFSAGALRANVTGSLSLPSGQQTPQHWFNTAAVGAPPPYTFGTSGPGILTSPGLVNFDFSLLKLFSFTERLKAELRGESFNAFNHTNFGRPGSALGSPTFGVITSARDGRVMQVGLRMFF